MAKLCNIFFVITLLTSVASAQSIWYPTSTTETNEKYLRSREHKLAIQESQIERYNSLPRILVESLASKLKIVSKDSQKQAVLPEGSAFIFCGLACGNDPKYPEFVSLSGIGDRKAKIRLKTRANLKNGDFFVCIGTVRYLAKEKKNIPYLEDCAYSAVIPKESHEHSWVLSHIKYFGYEHAIENIYIRLIVPRYVGAYGLKLLPFSFDGKKVPTSRIKAAAKAYYIYDTTLLMGEAAPKCAKHKCYLNAEYLCSLCVAERHGYELSKNQ